VEAYSFEVKVMGLLNATTMRCDVSEVLIGLCQHVYNTGA
jgi:hypothetical protein